MRNLSNFGYSCGFWQPLLMATMMILVLGERGEGQLVPDSTLGMEPTMVRPNTTVNGASVDLIEGGALRGANLFQSFSDFNVQNGQQVYFGNPAGVQNILTRVTGTNSSSIAGTLGVLGPANLFLINPNGLFFGPTARLDIQGSFVASTADRLTFPDGSDFSAKNPQVAPLLTVNLPVGLQYGAQPGAITSAANLAVGQNLTLAGGTVTSAGQLSAPAGQVTVTSVTGDVEVKNLTAQSAVLSSAGNLLLPESQLRTTGDLTLLAQDTVQARDSAANPFIASAGGQLVLQGQQQIDVFALNHPASGLFSGGDLILRSPNPVLGDAHYFAGGNFQIQQLNGQLGALYSPYDPVIRAVGGVQFSSYTGASLHIFAGGSVQVTGTIRITGADPANGLPDDRVTLSNGTSLAITGRTVPTLDIRAGTLNVGVPGLTPGAPAGFTPAPPFVSPGGASISLGTVILPSSNPGLVYLSNQYAPSGSAGDITVQRIDNSFDGFSSPAVNGGTVVIDSRGAIVLNPPAGTIAIDAGNYGFDPSLGGSVTLLAQGNIVLQGSGVGNTLISTTGPIGGPITLQSAADIFISQGGLLSQSTLFQPGKGGAITLQGRSINLDQVTLRAQSTIVAEVDAGDIVLLASDRILLNRSQLETSNEEGIFAPPLAPGSAGNIFLQAPQISILNGSVLSATTVNRGRAGNITLKGTDILIDGLGTAVRNQVAFGALGNGGTLLVDTSRLTLSGGASLQSQTQGVGTRAGDVIIQATDRVVLDAAVITSSVQPGATNAVGGNITITTPTLTLNGSNTRIFSSVQAPTAAASTSGQGGSINLQLNSLVLSNGAGIRSSTAGLQGNAGNIQIAGGSGSVDLFSGSQISSETTSVGAGGTIAITTGRFNATGGSQLRASTSNLGAAGQIQVSANQFQVTDGALLTASTTSAGRGGSVTVNAGSFIMNSGGQIRTSTSSSGNAGDITVLARDLIDIDGVNTGLFADTLPGATGQGGNIFIDPPVVRLANGATVSVNSLGSGNAGNLFLQARSLTLTNGASLTAFSANGLGGNIALDVQDVLLMRFGSLISAEAGNNGDGGNIAINSGFVVAVPDEASNIIANAFRGRGGNINIRTQTIFGFSLQRFQPPRSLISASSQFGLQGTITITTPGIDPSRGIVALPSGVVDASKLVAQGCTTEIADSTGTGRFVVTGRGGLPSAPGDSLGQDVIWEDVPAVESGGPRSQTRPPALAQGWSISEQGTVTLLPQPLNRCYAR